MYGRLIKTRFVLGHLADETERRAIGRQLNKAESLHALHDWLFHGRHGTVCTPSTLPACERLSWAGGGWRANLL